MVSTYRKDWVGEKYLVTSYVLHLAFGAYLVQHTDRCRNVIHKHLHSLILLFSLPLDIIVHRPLTVFNLLLLILNVGTVMGMEHG